MENKHTFNNSNGISVDYHALLMENHVPESIIDFDKGIRAIALGSERFCLFFIDKKCRLSALAISQDEASGWEKHTLSPEGKEVTAYAVWHDAVKNTVRIVFAFSRGEEAVIAVSTSKAITTNLQTDFTSGFSWEYKNFTNNKRIVNQMYADARGILFSSMKEGTDADYFYCGYQEMPKPYTLPENGHKIIQLELGKAFGQNGFFGLYEVGTQRTLLFQAVDADKFGEKAQFRLATPGRINRFSLHENSRGDSELLAAGEGIYRFQTPMAKAEEVVPATSEIRFSTIDSCMAETGEISVWVIGKHASHAGLYYITGKSLSAKKYSWSRPLQMHEAVSEFESIRGNQIRNHLFFSGRINKNDPEGLIHFWQDKSSGQWQETYISTSATDEIITLESYTAELAFQCDDFSKVIGKSVDVSCDETISLYLNNQRHLIPAGEKRTVWLDMNKLSVIFPASSLRTPVIRLGSEEMLTEDILIDPSNGAMQHLASKLGNAEALQNAKTATGKPLVQAGVNKDMLKEVAGAINEMAKHTDADEKATLPQAVKTEQPIALLKAAESSFFSTFTHSVYDCVGDIYHSVKKGFIEITEFVVKKVKAGFEFVVKIAGEVINFIVSAVKEVISFAERIFEKIKVFFKDLFDYLGFLFSWSDILDTKEAMKGFTLSAFKSFEDSIENIRKSVNKILDNLKENLDPEADFGNSLSDEKQKKASSSSDSRLSWLESKKSHLGNGKTADVISALPDSITGPVFDAAAEFMRYFDKYKNLLANALSGIAQKFMMFFKGEISIKSFLIYLVKSIAVISIEIVQDIINILLKVLKTAIEVIRKSLNASIEIPFFSALYKKVSGADLSILDIICLLIAVPTTVAYKLGEGEAPFKQASKQEFIKSGEALFAPLATIFE
jgi:hypothetical protein